MAGFRRYSPQLLLLLSRQICNGCCTRTLRSAQGKLAHLPAIKFLHLDKSLAPRQFVPRHCASAVNKITINIKTILLWISFVARHPCTAGNLYHDGRNRAILRSFRLVPGLYSDSTFVLQPPFSQVTNALYCRAVSCKARCDYRKFTIK